jgi:tetraacyldisaccharide 4'-kinase
MSKALLKIGAALYGVVATARGLLYDIGVLRAYRPGIPVVSIGNVTAGGNGKTPLCLLLASEFAARGMRPAILSRGYGGSERGPYRVMPTDSPSRVGDEPLLMARANVAPVYIARVRALGARRIESDGFADVIILDDGFQHRALARDVDIVSVFAGTAKSIEEFLLGKLLPEGLFREHRDAALKRASMIVVSERKVAAEGDAMLPLDERLLKALPPGVPVYRSFFEAAGVSHLKTGEPVAPGAVQALAAIANPETFFESLERLGFSIAARHAFPDHHPFSEGELVKIVEQHPGMPVICTAKDAVKLEGMSERVRGACAVLNVKLRVVPADAFMVQIQRKILSGRQGE